MPDYCMSCASDVPVGSTYCNKCGAEMRGSFASFGNIGKSAKQKSLKSKRRQTKEVEEDDEENEDLEELDETVAGLDDWNIDSWEFEIEGDADSRKKISDLAAGESNEYPAKGASKTTKGGKKPSRKKILSDFKKQAGSSRSQKK